MKKSTKKSYFEMTIIEQKKVIYHMIKRVRSIPKYGHADKYNIYMSDDTMDDLHGEVTLSLWEVVANGGEVDGLAIYQATMQALDSLYDRNSKLSLNDFYNDESMLYWLSDEDENMMLNYGTLPKINDVLKEYDGMTAAQIIERAAYNDKQKQFLEMVAYTDMSIKDCLKESGYKAVKKDKGEKGSMEKELKVEGMKCEHCAARVTKALKAVQGVVEAEVSLEKGNAIVRMDIEIPDELLRDAVKEAGYEVTQII